MDGSAAGSPLATTILVGVVSILAIGFAFVADDFLNPRSAPFSQLPQSYQHEGDARLRGDYFEATVVGQSIPVENSIVRFKLGDEFVEQPLSFWSETIGDRLEAGEWICLCGSGADCFTPGDPRHMSEMLLGEGQRIEFGHISDFPATNTTAAPNGTQPA